jgi:hypothetical protein
MEAGPSGAKPPGGEAKGNAMTQTPAFTREGNGTGQDGGAAPQRVHSETAAEGTDGTEMPEIRMHSQDAAEGPDLDA